MPAASEGEPARLTVRPLGVRMVGIVAGLGLLAVAVGAWIAFGPDVRARFTVFQKSTLVAIVIGAGALVTALVRSRLEIDGDKVVVVNGYRRRDLEGAQVVALRLRRGAPWAEMDLSDGTSIAVMAIQGSDGDRATRAVRTVRAMLSDPRPPADERR